MSDFFSQLGLCQPGIHLTTCSIHFSRRGINDHEGIRSLVNPVVDVARAFEVERMKNGNFNFEYLAWTVYFN